VRIVLVILAALLVLLQLRLWVSDDGYRSARRLADQASAQQLENEQLAERNRALAAEVADLKSGVDAAEEIARSELGMIRTGETLFQVVDSEDDDADLSPEGR
jgi:cell division protein FtsB